MDSQVVVRQIVLQYDNETKEQFNKSLNNVTSINKLTELENRNNYIINTLNQLRTEKNKILVLSDRIAQLKTLKFGFDKLVNSNLLSCKTYLFTASNYNQNSDNELENSNIIFATYNLVAEGIFIKNLYTIVLASPKVQVTRNLNVALRNVEYGDYLTNALIVDFVDELSIFKKLTIGRQQTFLIQKCFLHTFEPMMMSFIEENQTI